MKKFQVVFTETQKKEQEWISACKVDAVDKSDEYDPFLVGAYSKQIFKYMMTLEVLNHIKLIGSGIHFFLIIFFF